jgi:hypothetical protein
MRGASIIVLPMLLFALGMGMVVSYFAPANENWILVWAGIIVTIFPFLIAAARKSFDPFEPVYLFAVCFLLLFVLRPASDLLGPAGVPILDLGRKHIDVRPQYGYALALALVAGAAFYAGYYLPLAKRLARKIPIPGGEWEHSSFDLLVVIGIIGAVLLFLAYIVSTGLLTDPQAGLDAILYTSRAPEQLPRVYEHPAISISRLCC